MRPNAILKMLHRALKRTGLPKIRFHDFMSGCKNTLRTAGHYSAGFTPDTYAYANLSNVAFVAQKNHNHQ